MSANRAGSISCSHPRHHHELTVSSSQRLLSRPAIESGPAAAYSFVTPFFFLGRHIRFPPPGSDIYTHPR